MADKKKILLLEDDPKITSQISEILSDYDILCETKSARFIANILDSNPDLLLIDFDLHEKDGLLVYREIRQLFPHNKTVMFSSSNSIPLAVTATKLGVLEFLRKPFDQNALKDAVKKATSLKDLPLLDLSGFDDIEWLSGASDELRNTLDRLRLHANSNNDLVISSGIGVNKRISAEILHKNGSNSDKRFVEINLSSFDHSMSEAHLFLTLKELLSSWDFEGAVDKKDLPGTIYIPGVDSAAEPVRLSLTEFIKIKKSPVKIILGASDTSGLSQFEIFNIPDLSARKADIPIIALAYLKKYAPQVKYIAPQILEFFVYYDFPGNYLELKDLIIAFSAAYPQAEVLNFKSMPIDMKLFQNVLKNKLFSKEKYELKEVIWEFERAWIEIVFSKVNGDIHAASRFLDIPKTVLSERIKNLELLQ